jgi:RimJ/RimL family protein N-acetyltransferase
MIYAARIRFRAPERSDLPQYVEWLNDPEVRQGLSLFLPLSMADEEKWYENMLSTSATEHPFAIDVREEGAWTHIGNCGFHGIDWRCRSSEVGIFIGDKSYWNHGYGTEAMSLLLKHGFETLNMNRIFLRVFENNPRAIRSYEKAGFQHEGRFRQGEFQQGHYQDVLFMSVLRDEWKG